MQITPATQEAEKLVRSSLCGIFDFPCQVEILSWQSRNISGSTNKLYNCMYLCLWKTHQAELRARPKARWPRPKGSLAIRPWNTKRQFSGFGFNWFLCFRMCIALLGHAI